MPCEACVYRFGGEIQKDLSRQLFCRRYPPQVIALPTPKGIQLTGMHPMVTPEHECGEYQPDPTRSEDLVRQDIERNCPQ